MEDILRQKMRVNKEKIKMPKPRHATGITFKSTGDALRDDKMGDPDIRKRSRSLGDESDIDTTVQKVVKEDPLSLEIQNEQSA